MHLRSHNPPLGITLRYELVDASGKALLPITAYGVRLADRWSYLFGQVAEWAGCDSDDVNVIETDDGDRVTVHGEIVGELIDRDIQDELAAASQIGRAA